MIETKYSSHGLEDKNIICMNGDMREIADGRSEYCTSFMIVNRVCGSEDTFCFSADLDRKVSLKLTFLYYQAKISYLVLTV